MQDSPARSEHRKTVERAGARFNREQKKKKTWKLMRDATRLQRHLLQSRPRPF
jgi:hypothetical protein